MYQMTSNLDHHIKGAEVARNFIYMLDKRERNEAKHGGEFIPKQFSAEYVWIGPDRLMKSKAKTISKIPERVSDLENWSTSSTDADGKNWYLIPRRMFKDPFRGYPNMLVLCDCYKEDGITPIETNNRKRLADAEEKCDCDAWFGFEQEYTLYAMDGHVFGWPGELRHRPVDQGPSYCGVGASFVYGRFMMEAHYAACKYAGVTISGINCEEMPGSFEYQIGPCSGLEMGDHAWIARYIMERLGEIFQLHVSLEPKPEQGYAGAGGHMNFSTKQMREEGGIKYIYEAIDRLESKHDEHMKGYGEGNEERLNGSGPSSSTKFTGGIEDRKSSVRITKDVVKAGKGFFEDRRPAANCDPYLVSALLIETCVLNSTTGSSSSSS